MQAYSNPAHERDPHRLPDLDIFYLPAELVKDAFDNLDSVILPGWYYDFCFPGCLPYGESEGPFASYHEALTAARAHDDIHQD